MPAPPRFLIGRHPQRGMLWAAIDPNARFTGSQLSETRFGGYLKPYPDEQAARAALVAAGAKQIELEERKRGKRRG